MNLEGYEVIKEINRGPVATVYLARQIALDRQVFLKVLNKNIHDQPDLLERFKREARICARLNHPNIVNIFDFGDAEGSFYLILEYVDGRPLDELIKEFNPLPLPVILYIFYEVARGLHYAHQNGVLHRDIKPANIMIGKDGSVKITDFGLATSADLPNLTLQQTTVGTPAYMSPEQAMGKKVDARSDIFSLGVTIYETCAGFNPFLGQNIVDTLNHVLLKKPKPLSSLRADCDQWLDEMISSMLEKKPEQRLASLQVLLDHPQFKENRLEQQQFLKFLENPESFKVTGQSETEATEIKPESNRRKPVIHSLVSLLIILILVSIYLKERNKNPETVAHHTFVDSSTVTQPDTQKVLEKLPAKSQPIATSGSEEELAVNSKKIQPKPEEQNVELTVNPDQGKLTKGRLFILCTPWAQVFIDNEFVDTTPLGKALELKVGEHQLTLKNPNYQEFTQNVKITPGQTDTLTFHLQPKTGTLQISAFPWGRVFVDDSLMGITPLKLELPSGRHRLTVENPNFTSYSDSLIIRPGERVEKRIQLKK